ncbi:LodA/GoxA family CTQ-dependent oxidase [Acinetobacter beijerinckii]|uniref:LodA/GoxA family CTQ-dependent oxidase n=1 Tax=Acinetobacter beijerinckii TaxID=262668 RepID=UPI0040550D70
MDKPSSTHVTSCVDCSQDPITSLKNMFVDMVQAGRIVKGQCPAMRPVFLKAHGVAAAEFIIRDDLPENLRIGLFAETKKKYPAWIRFSSDTTPTSTDFKSTLGIGIKLFDVDGEKLLGNPHADTFDFIMQNFDAFFVDTAKDMCEFTKAGVVDGDYTPYLNAHPKTSELLDAMAKPVASVLVSPYWSGLPFHFGENQYVKYKLEPTFYLDPPTHSPNDPSYLGQDLVQRLSQSETRFRFMIQLRTDPQRMPLDEATVVWSEYLSPPIHVADIVIPIQDISARGQAEYGENLAMNIWRVTQEHAPVGSIAEARKVVYAASAELPRNVNGVPLSEPDVPRPLISPAAVIDTHIVRAAIHPAIGIARVGDSETEFFIGPEIVDALSDPNQKPNNFRDETGAIKRQAARFRIYGYNAAGEVVRELNPDNADIVWTVHVANRKSQWYQFQYALDIPEAVNAPDNAFTLRNPKVKDRKKLAIDPGPRSISGRNTIGGTEHRFDTGTFQAVAQQPVIVPLGEIQTDENGRLLFLGGHGKSASPTNAPVYDPDNPPSFNNADDWYDDTSDGPVTATVSINGVSIPVESAWVVVAPPNYAPDVVSWRTMYDLMCDVYVNAGWMTMPEMPSFTHDILPLLKRLGGLQWVNKGFAAYFGKGCPMDFNNPDLLSKLSFKPKQGISDPYTELRRAIFHSFRPSKPVVAEPVAWPHVWPWIYGDAFGSFSESGTGNMLTMTGLQEALLRHWVEGKFLNDWSIENCKPETSIDKVPLAQQPNMLDQAALHYCLADTFHPGCEMTWPMRHASLYSSPFRIRSRINDVEPNYGSTMTPIKVQQVDGPLYGQIPGSITRWMAVPWQGDTAFCRSGYDPDYDPYLPTFWAARVPNHVLTEVDYQQVINDKLPREQRIAAFNQRQNWLRSIMDANVADVMMRMIEHFNELGIVEIRPGLKNDPDIPEYLYVETLIAGKLKESAEYASHLLQSKPRPLNDLEKAGWASHEQLQAFRSVRVQKR